MNYKYKNGFTLIELLAVILILGIIALIAVPVVNDVLNDSKMGAFKTTAMNLASKAEENCQLEGIKEKRMTQLYTIVDGKLDKPLEIKGDIPNEGYILINSNCEVAYSFYDSKNVVSKNFKEDTPTINNKDTAPVYGLKWQSNKTTLDDTYTRTFDSSNIEDNAVKAQIGETPVTNAFDDLDIYKDILPYTDEFGNEFMLIPKFYISKTKEVTDTEVIWNYAVSKHKLDNTYYLPSNFVDEGVDNNQHIELPYVLVGKYEAGSNGQTSEDEMLVSIPNIMPKININMNEARDLSTRYNKNEINGYQQYDIHIHDIIFVLFSIEFKTVNSQNIMKGFVDKELEEGKPSITGASNFISSSSGSLSNDGFNSFNYRGIENLWGSIWTFVDGLILDQINGTRDTIYVAFNSRNYYTDEVTDEYKEIEEYKLQNDEGYIKESGFDPKYPFVTLPTEVGGSYDKGIGDNFWNNDKEEYLITFVGGRIQQEQQAGLNFFDFNWNSSGKIYHLGARLVKTPLRN